MNKINIESKFFLVEGGCNACGLLNCVTYTINFPDGTQATSDQLDAVHLTQAIALKNGWREKVEPVGIGEEAVFLEKGKDAVQVSEDSFKTTFSKGAKKFPIKKEECSLKEVWDNTNALLTDFFGITAYDFELTE